MKKLFAAVLAAVLAISVAGCSGGGDSKTITVGASPTPHAEILKVAAELMKEDGYTLNIKEFTDYVQPNLALDAGDLDANFFQHITYLENFNDERGTKLASLCTVHYEPFGIYPGKTKAIADLPDGAQIAVPNDTTNEARALLLLESEGLIKLKEGAGLNATALDIVENPKNIKIQEIEAAQLGRSLQDVDLAVINGNYALGAGLKVGTDALAVEASDSMAGDAYANVVAVRQGDENREALQALKKALQSDKVKQYIEDHYDGAVISKF